MLWDYKHMPLYLALGFWGLNSGLCAYVAGILPTEPDTRPSKFIFKLKKQKTVTAWTARNQRLDRPEMEE